MTNGFTSVNVVDSALVEFIERVAVAGDGDKAKCGDTCHAKSKQKND